MKIDVRYDETELEDVSEYLCRAIHIFNRDMTITVGDVRRDILNTLKLYQQDCHDQRASLRGRYGYILSPLLVEAGCVYVSILASTNYLHRKKFVSIDSNDSIEDFDPLLIANMIADEGD